MANVDQHDIDAIVVIQHVMTPSFHVVKEIPVATIRDSLRQLPWLAKTSDTTLDTFIVINNKRCIGVDTIALLKSQYDVAEASQLQFKHLKLGGTLLRNAREVTFEQCDFTTSHNASHQMPAFIKTGDDLMNDFTGARFIACDLHEVLFKNVTLNKAYFAKTKLSATQFLYSDLANCEFESITFNRTPRFVHSNLYHSHAHMHIASHNRASRIYDKTALLGGLLISASALMITLMMFSVIPSQAAYSTLAIGLLISGVILGYLGATSAFREKTLAESYRNFEQVVDMNAESDKHDELKVRGQARR